MNPLRGYQEPRNLSDEQMADTLSALLGRKITANGYRLHSRRPTAPKEWAAVLGLNGRPSPEQTASLNDSPSPESPGSPDPAGASEQPPRPPEGATVVQEVAALDIAEARIRDTYGLLGFSLSTVTGNRGIAVVTDTYSPQIARAWIKAAEENEFCARVVKLMGSGGATGELVVTHTIWIMGLLYVSGRIPNVGGLFTRFDGFRPVVSAEPPPDTDGAAPFGPEGPLGDAAFAPGV